MIDGDWYRTGDLGFIDDKGFLTLYSRIKDVIKYKGCVLFFPLLSFLSSLFPSLFPPYFYPLEIPPCPRHSLPNGYKG